MLPMYINSLPKMQSNTCSFPSLLGQWEGEVVVTFVLDVVKYILGDGKSYGGGTHRSV
jgi:hypothetical protein